MRIPTRKTLGTGVVAVGVLTLALACKGSSSNMVSAPEVAPAASVAGTWTGTFRSDSSACASSQITATFQQTGTQVTGTLSGSSCGTSGAFKGTISGNQLMGNVEMLGCSGGAVNATVSGSGLSLTVADLTRPIVSGDQVVMYGGAATLQR